MLEARLSRSCVGEDSGATAKADLRTVRFVGLKAHAFTGKPENKHSETSLGSRCSLASFVWAGGIVVDLPGSTISRAPPAAASGALSVGSSIYCRLECAPIVCFQSLSGISNRAIVD